MRPWVQSSALEIKQSLIGSSQKYSVSFTVMDILSDMPTRGLGRWDSREPQTPRSVDVQLESPVSQDLQLQVQWQGVRAFLTLSPSANRALSEDRVHTRAAEVMGVDLGYAQEGRPRVLRPVFFISKLKSLIWAKPQMNGSVHLSTCFLGWRERRKPLGHWIQVHRGRCWEALDSAPLVKLKDLK